MDWREIFKRYVNVVGQYEGVDFLYEDDWTPDEWASIREAVAEADRVVETTGD